jgi:hypothetical protein
VFAFVCFHASCVWRKITESERTDSKTKEIGIKDIDGIVMNFNIFFAPSVFIYRRKKEGSLERSVTPCVKSICVFCLLFSQSMGMANYERLSRIGKGTFGVVYQARHRNSGKILGEYRASAMVLWFGFGEKGNYVFEAKYLDSCARSFERDTIGSQRWNP